MQTNITAYIFTGNHINQLGAVNEEMPGCMVPLLDRPWLQHLVENLITHGIRNIHFFNCDMPHRIEEHFQDGKRWGASFTYHLCRDEMAQLKRLRLQSELAEADLILLARANSILFDIPDFSLSENCRPAILGPADKTEELFNWYLVKPAELKQAGDFAAFGDLGGHLKSQIRDNQQSLACREFLLLDQAADLIAAQKEALSGRLKGLLCNAAEIEPGIRIARNVSIAPSAKIAAPVFIGENSQISDKAEIGPNTSIGSDCIVDSSSKISNSSIFPGTYVGEYLNIDNSIVNQSMLLNLDINGQIFLDEKFLLGTIRSGGFSAMLQSVCWRITALIIFIAFLPVLILAATVSFVMSGRGRCFNRRTCISTPNTLNEPQIRQYSRLSLSSADLSDRKKYFHSLAHFILEFLPGLPAVIMGRLELVGLQPRTAEEFQKMSHGHQKIFLKGKSGLVTENQVYFGGIANPQELTAAEALHLAKDSFSYNLKLFTRYLFSFLSLPR